MLVIPNGGIDRVTQLHPQAPAAPAAQHGQTPEQVALTKAVSHLTKPGESATLSVTASGHTNLFGAEVKASGSASITVTYNSPGNYTVALSETQEAGVKVASGDGEDPKPSEKGSGQTRPAGPPSGIVLGPEFGGTGRPPGEPLPPDTGVVPVAGGAFTGITAPRVGIFAQAKPPQQEEGSGGQVVGVTIPGSSNVQSTPSLSAESTVDVTSTVTVQVRTPAQATQAANAFAVMAAQPRAGSFVDNPIMDQITGKSGPVAGVSPADLDLLHKNVTSYGETVTGSGSVVAGLKTSFGTNSLSKLDLSLQNSQQVSLSRTITLPTSSTPGNPAEPGSVAYAVSAQTSTQPTSSIFGTSTNNQGSQQVSFTQTYNLNDAKEIADPEGTLTSRGLWLKPNTVQQQLQTQLQLGATANLPQGSSAGNTLVRTTTTTATLTNPDPRALTGAAQSFQSKPTQPGGPQFTVKTDVSTVENNTVGVGGDWPVSGSLTISEPV